MSTRTDGRYHHGDLRNALVDASIALAAVGGPDAVVLREAARRSGVSPTAAYRHFADRSELLGAVAHRALGTLTTSMQRELDTLSPDDDPHRVALARLVAVGRGYVRFALAEPGLFRTAFSVLGVPRPDPDGGRWPTAYGMLAECIDGLVAAGLLSADRRAGAEYPAWSAVHGLATLLLGPLSSLPAVEQDRAIERTLQAVVSGLTGVAERLSTR